MKYVVTYSNAAARGLRTIEAQMKGRIMRGVNGYAENGHGDVTTMKGHPGEYRLRIGDYRVRFALDVVRGEMLILHVGHRREVYR